MIVATFAAWAFSTAPAAFLNAGMVTSDVTPVMFVVYQILAFAFFIMAIYAIAAFGLSLVWNALVVDAAHWLIRRSAFLLG
jgi:hypothetical protein